MMARTTELADNATIKNAGVSNMSVFPRDSRLVYVRSIEGQSTMAKSTIVRTCTLGA